MALHFTTVLLRSISPVPAKIERATGVEVSSAARGDFLRAFLHLSFSLMGGHLRFRFLDDISPNTNTLFQTRSGSIKEEDLILAQGPRCRLSVSFRRSSTLSHPRTFLHDKLGRAYRKVSSMAASGCP